MAVIIQLEWPGLTREMFDQARSLVGWEQSPPKGSIVQSQAWENGVFNASDIWETEEDWNNFLQDRVLPNVAGLNIPGQPTVRVYEAYAYFIAGAREPAHR